MALVSTGEILRQAAENARGAGAFNVVQIEHAEAIVAGAEAAGLPVILQVSENTARYHGALAPIGLAALSIARTSQAAVAVHLDHAESAELVRESVELGFSSVMFDAARLPYAANVAATREITEYCHSRGVWVEAELGEIGGKDGAHAPGVRTDPAEAREFVAATAVDALAVAVGSSHAMRTRDAVPDMGLIARLHGAVDVPLVLHGASGVADVHIAEAVRAGMRKVNISTHLNMTFTRTVREQLAANPGVADPRRYLGPARDAVAGEVARLLRVLDLEGDGAQGGERRPPEGGAEAVAVDLA
jgi:fructose-bisphosphate aldolase class II